MIESKEQLRVVPEVMYQHLDIQPSIKGRNAAAHQDFILSINENRDLANYETLSLNLDDHHLESSHNSEIHKKGNLLTIMTMKVRFESLHDVVDTRFLNPHSLRKLLTRESARKGFHVIYENDEEKLVVSIDNKLVCFIIF